MITNFRITPAVRLYLAGVFLFNACGSTKSPIWLNPIHRNNSEFIHGFSKVSKLGKAEEYIGQARTYSLGTIAQGIKTNIDATSINKIKELIKLYICSLGAKFLILNILKFILISKTTKHNKDIFRE